MSLSELLSCPSSSSLVPPSPSRFATLHPSRAVLSRGDAVLGIISRGLQGCETSLHCCSTSLHCCSMGLHPPYSPEDWMPTCSCPNFGLSPPGIMGFGSSDGCAWAGGCQQWCLTQLCPGVSNTDLTCTLLLPEVAQGGDDGEGAILLADEPHSTPSWGWAKVLRAASSLHASAEPQELPGSAEGW